MDVKLITILLLVALVVISACIFIQKSIILSIEVLFGDMTIELAIKAMKKDISRTLRFFAWPFISIGKAFRCGRKV